MLKNRPHDRKKKAPIGAFLLEVIYFSGSSGRTQMFRKLMGSLLSPWA